MRGLPFFFLLVLFSCSAPPSDAIPSRKMDEKMSDVVEADSLPKEKALAPDLSRQPDSEVKEPVFPYLTDANCEAFLLQYGKENPQNRVKMITPYGEIVLRLYDDTPLHRANFIYLINRGYFNPVEMTRVIKDFMVQGGNSESPRPASQRTIIGSYTLPAEFHFHRMHKKGALSLSRSYDEEKNPDKRSAPYDFFIVDGAIPGTVGIYKAEEARGKRYTRDQVKVYKSQGGAIHLDQEHTVFGEIVSGMAVLNKMTEVETDQADWPRERLDITIELFE